MNEELLQRRKRILEGIFKPYQVPVSEFSPILSEEFLQRRDDLILKIYTAFAGVNRIGGISWSEAGAIDQLGTEEDHKLLGEKDLGGNWEELIDDQSWDTVGAWSAWSFLDSIGFRYYLPAVMVRCIRSGSDENISFHLTLDPFMHLRKYQLAQWSALTVDQRTCVKEFLQYMIALSELWPEKFRSFAVDIWRKPLLSYWIEESTP